MDKGASCSNHTTMDSDDEPPPLLEEQEEIMEVLTPGMMDVSGCLHCHVDCAAIQVRCDECQSFICQSCHWCHEFQANHEIRVCDRCDAFYCRSCDEMDQCEDCGEVVCASCSTLLSCKFCGCGLCEECATACGRCGIVLCSRDAKFAVDCDTCRLSYCLVCLASGSKDPCVRCGHRPSKRMEQLVHLRLKSIYKAFTQTSNGQANVPNIPPKSFAMGSPHNSDDEDDPKMLLKAATAAASSGSKQLPNVPLASAASNAIMRQNANSHPAHNQHQHQHHHNQHANQYHHQANTYHNQYHHQANTYHNQYHHQQHHRHHHQQHQQHSQHQHDIAAKQMIDRYMQEKRRADAAAEALLAELDEEEEAIKSKKSKKKKKKERQQARKDEEERKKREEQQAEQRAVEQAAAAAAAAKAAAKTSNANHSDHADQQQQPKGSSKKSKKKKHKSRAKNGVNKSMGVNATAGAGDGKIDGYDVQSQVDVPKAMKASATADGADWHDNSIQNEKSDNSSTAASVADLSRTDDDDSFKSDVVDPMEEKLRECIESEDIAGLEAVMDSIRGVPGKAALRKNGKKALRRLRQARDEILAQEHQQQQQQQQQQYYQHEGKNAGKSYPSQSNADGTAHESKNRSEYENRPRKFVNRRYDHVEAILTCEQRFVPLLIGRRGWTVKQIQDSSGARIDIDQTVDPRKIKISGSASSVEVATRYVQDVLNYPLAQQQGQEHREMSISDALAATQRKLLSEAQRSGNPTVDGTKNNPRASSGGSSSGKVSSGHNTASSSSVGANGSVNANATVAPSKNNDDKNIVGKSDGNVDISSHNYVLNKAAAPRKAATSAPTPAQAQTPETQPAAIISNRNSSSSSSNITANAALFAGSGGISDANVINTMVADDKSDLPSAPMPQPKPQALSLPLPLPLPPNETRQDSITLPTPPAGNPNPVQQVPLPSHIADHQRLGAVMAHVTGYPQSRGGPQQVPSAQMHSHANVPLDALGQPSQFDNDGAYVTGLPRFNPPPPTGHTYAPQPSHGYGMHGHPGPAFVAPPSHLNIHSGGLNAHRLPTQNGHVAAPGLHGLEQSNPHPNSHQFHRHTPAHQISQGHVDNTLNIHNLANLPKSVPGRNDLLPTGFQVPQPPKPAAVNHNLWDNSVAAPSNGTRDAFGASTGGHPVRSTISPVPLGFDVHTGLSNLTGDASGVARPAAAEDSKIVDSMFGPAAGESGGNNGATGGGSSSLLDGLNGLSLEQPAASGIWGLDMGLGLTGGLNPHAGPSSAASKGRAEIMLEQALLPGLSDLMKSSPNIQQPTGSRYGWEASS